MAGTDKRKTGERIGKLMEAQHLSVQGLAVRLDVTENAVRNYLKGKNLPSADKMIELCNIFKINTLEELIVRKEKESENEVGGEDRDE